MHTNTVQQVEEHESKLCVEWCNGGGGVRSPVPGLKTQTLANIGTGVVFTDGPFVRRRHLYLSPRQNAAAATAPSALTENEVLDIS